MSVTVNGATSTPPPLVAFDPDGTASVISYELPEAMSYTGRHVIDLPFSGADFVDIAATAGLPVSSIVGSTPPTTTPPLLGSVAAPPSVVLSDPSKPTSFVVQLAPFPLSARLGALTWDAVQQASGLGKQFDIVRSLGGQLDYTVRDAPDKPQLPVTTTPPASTGTAHPMERTRPPTRGDSGDPATTPDLEVEIRSPSASSPNLPPTGVGPVSGYPIVVTGHITYESTVLPTVTVQVDSGAAQAVTMSGLFFHAPLTLPAGSHTISVRAQARETSSTKVLASADSVIVNVTLGTDPAPPTTPPTVTITSPDPNHQIVSTDGRAIVTVTGTVDAHGAAHAPTVTLTASGAAVASSTATVTMASDGTGTWTAPIDLSTYGTHAITAVAAPAATDGGFPGPSIGITVSVVAKLPSYPIDRRLFVIETIAISSFLGDYGAGRLVKTFSLLPGESTTLSLETYTKTEETSKSASSILDSAASESADDFESTIASEQDHKAASANSTAFTLAAEMGANWGWGNASVKATLNTTANSSREEATKNVSNALQKHASKASTNRSVQVNSEFTRSDVGTNTDTTKRTLSNINVSRVLNFVFRQMVQEHVVMIHLTDAKIGYWQQDLLILADGTAGDVVESYAEYALPEFYALASQVLSGGDAGAQRAQQSVIDMLSSVVGADGELVALVEMTSPTRGGEAQPNEQYLRVRLASDLHGQWQPRPPTAASPSGGPTFTVPGIVLSRSQIVMRTDGVLVDAVLGEGDGLDAYSHGLQEAAVDAQGATLSQQRALTAREELAQAIVKSKDADQAALFVKLFPPPPAPVVVGGSPASGGGGTP